LFGIKKQIKVLDDKKGWVKTRDLSNLDPPELEGSSVKKKGTLNR